jgi:excisionase family DNA binding protein
MTQTEFDDLPLLLDRAEVFEALPVLSRRSLDGYREDGDLRTFHPDPEGSRYSYYFKADVGRIHGRLTVGTEWLEELDEWLGVGEFSEVTGLPPKTVRRACETGQLASVRHEGGYRRFYRDDLKWFF